MLELATVSAMSLQTNRGQHVMILLSYNVVTVFTDAFQVEHLPV